MSADVAQLAGQIASTASSNKRSWHSYTYLLLLPLALAFAIWFCNPFSSTLVSQSVSLSELNPAQRMNIRLAARAINGTVLRPGESFSFNAAVGPRTAARGFQAARAYIGSESPLTTGGGICCLSSVIYQCALRSDLTITERVAHGKSVLTVPPGLDATVWWKGPDLRFRNDHDYPVMIVCSAGRNSLVVQFAADRFAGGTSRTDLRTQVTAKTKDKLAVEVFRRREGREVLISRDFYRLSP